MSSRRWISEGETVADCQRKVSVSVSDISKYLPLKWSVNVCVYAEIFLMLQMKWNCLMTNLTTPAPPHNPLSRIYIEKLTCSRMFILRNPKFHSPVSTTCPCPKPHQSSPYPHPISRKSILILSSHLHLGLPSGSFPHVSPSKTLHTPLLYPIRATFLAPLILLNFITRILLTKYF